MGRPGQAFYRRIISGRARHEVLKACRQLDRVGCIVGEFHAIPDVDADGFFSLLDGYEILENNVLDGQGTFLASRRDER